MGAYVESFNRDFIGLSGDHDSISKLAAQFFVGYNEASSHASHNVPGNAVQNDKENDRANSKLIEHSGHIAVVNPAGQYVAVLRAPHRDQDIARVLQIITGN
jgi:cytochrome oxidase Cu insertion factor (SCO1/SenC/PrrC family)